MRYVLDTDVLIDILRGYEPAVDWFSTLLEPPAVVSLSLMELVQGCRNNQELSQVEQLANPLEIWYPDAEEMRSALVFFQAHYLKCRLSIIDAIIGSVCVARQGILCTFNVRHYRWINDLLTLQPYFRNPTTAQ
ncbi:MAG: PIN domain-containing protein [Fimbriimonadales bacterium]|nr:MAG: hypothetical protein KatS3mg018_0527 [Fimbriimonadales bacterium]